MYIFMKRMLFLPVLFLALYAQAQQTVTGTVTSMEDESGIPGVPHIYEAIIPTSASGDSGLKVHLKIKTNN